MDFDIFLAEMLPIKQAINRQFTTSPQLTRASALHGKTGKHENHIFTQLDCVTRTMHLCTVFLKEKLSSVMYLVASNIYWDSKISH